MPQTLYDMLGLLQTTAQARPDINTPGSTGVLENSRPYTFAGRVGDANQLSNMAAMLSRAPTESPDAEGMGGAAMAAGIPLGRMMRLPAGTNLDATMENMWQQFSKGHPGASKDQWMQQRLNDLAMSAYREGSESTRGGMPLGTIVMGNEGNIQGVPVMHQLAATLNAADRGGMLNAKTLGRATARQGEEFRNPQLSQQWLDQLSNYLEQIRPSRK